MYGVYIIFISFPAVFIVLNNIYLNLVLYFHNYSNVRIYMKYAVERRLLDTLSERYERNILSLLLQTTDWWFWNALMQAAAANAALSAQRNVFHYSTHLYIFH